MIQAAKIIGTGLATTGLIGANAGISESYIDLIWPSFSIMTEFLGINLESLLTMPGELEMNINEPFNAPSSSAGTGNNFYVTGDNNGNIDRPWLDLRLVKYHGNYYVLDSVQRDGTNLIGQLQQDSVQKKAELVDLYINPKSKGISLDLDSSSKLSSVSFQGRKYQGTYVDLKFPESTITSHNIPIQKNENGSIFIIWKRLGPR